MRRLVLLAALSVAVAACGDAEVKSGPGDDVAPAATDPEPVMLTCGEGLPFPSDALEGPTGAEDADTPEAAVLREIVERRRAAGPEDPLPLTGYRVLADNEHGVVFGSGQPPRMGFVTVWREDGGLEWGPASTCVTRRDREGFEPGRWKVHGIPRLDSNELVVDVQESACASGQAPGDRLQPAEVVEDDESVTITFWIESQSGFQDCPGNPDTTITIQLDRDLGTRTLLDGARYPPQDIRGGDEDPTTSGPGGSSSTVTTGPSTTTTIAAGEPPADADAARAEIDRAFHTAFDAGISQEERLTAVEDGPELLEAGLEAAAKYPGAAKSITVTVHSITFLEPTRAAVTFELLYSDAMLLGPQNGEALVVDGSWKVSRTTRCAIIEQAGVTCP